MIEYIYFVKCPNCEDEPFDFLDDAKSCAMGRLTQKPIITQTEVCRNDFGECTDSSDLGTVWSWEDMMKDVPEDTALTTFSKAETLDCDDDYFNCEFDEIDNSLDSVPDNFRMPKAESITEAAITRVMVNWAAQNLGDFYKMLKTNNPKEGSSEWFRLCRETDDKCRERWGLTSEKEIDKLIRKGYGTWKYLGEKYEDKESGCKSVPDDMTIESLIEEMEENEDVVECKVCEELFEKAKCRKDPKRGWVCEACGSKSIKESSGVTTWTCFFDDREVGSVVASTREEAMEKMMDEYPEYHYGLYDGCFWVEPEDESFDESITPVTEAFKDNSITLHYDDLIAEIVTKEIPATLEDPPEAVRDDYQGPFDYQVDINSVEEALWDHCLTEEDVKDFPGGFDALEDDTNWKAFMAMHFEDLVEKYYDKLLEIFRDDASEAAVEEFQERFDEDDGYLG